jgi:hypothetical protein
VIFIPDERNMLLFVGSEIVSTNPKVYFVHRE